MASVAWLFVRKAACPMHPHNVWTTINQNKLDEDLTRVQKDTSIIMGSQTQRSFGWRQVVGRPTDHP